ncbi:MAG: putative N6-adenine-specific DNA methylase [Saprospiraceae bacterium]|jgi:putative N6-adenine-specific DNA methylase
MMKLFIKTFKGLEEILFEEIISLGGKKVKVEKRGVSCEGDKAFMYKCNLHLRTALRVLVPVEEYIVHTERDFYRKMKKVDWSKYMDINQTFAIDAVVHSRAFNHSKFIALRAKDGLVDQFRERYDIRPNVDVKNPDVRFNIHIAEKKVILSLDSSGYSLHKRGYRTERHVAPINEALAAGLVLQSGWNGKTPFIDPMCGSGTIVVEAALIAKNRAPRLYSESLGFTKWNDFDQELWEKVKTEAQSQENEIKVPIKGGDLSQDYVEMAQRSVARMKLEDDVAIKHISFFDSVGEENGGVMIANPPYGERLDDDSDEINAFYKKIGDQMKTNYKGYSAWIISSNMQALKFVGLKPKRKIPLMNGALECKVHQYELYAGTRKIRSDSDE